MTDYAKQQKQIDLEALARRIMLRLVQYQSLTDRGSLDDGFVWTDRAIARRLHYDDVEAVYKALCWLRDSGYVQQRDREWVKTEAGEAVFCEEIKDTRLNVNPQEFRREALTGCDSSGKQSDLTRAALPGCEAYANTTDIMESICDHTRATREIAKIVGLPFQETVIGLISGRIGVCRWCEKIKVFGKKGDRFQSRCPECMAKMMRERRASK